MHKLQKIVAYQPMKESKHYGQTIRLARIKEGLTQIEFAKNENIAQSVLSRYETGKITPPADLVMRCTYIIKPHEAPSNYSPEALQQKLMLISGKEHLEFRQAISALIDLTIS